MARSLSLPNDAKAIYGQLALMPDDQYARFQTFVQALPTDSIFSVTLDRALKTQKPSDRTIFNKVLNELGRLSNTMATLEATADQTINAIVDQALEQADANRAALNHRLRELTSIKAIGLHVRAFQLLYEEERCLFSSRIITDIRPIFDASAEAPEGFVIVNHLHLTYLENRGYKNIFFALDEDDIDQLSSLATRAKAKIRSLKTVIPSHSKDAEQ